MKEYEVMVPIVGYMSVIVEAETEEEAQEKAMAEDVTINLESQNAELMEWDLVEKVVQGNVCYAPLFEIEITEI